MFALTPVATKGLPRVQILQLMRRHIKIEKTVECIEEGSLTPMMMRMDITGEEFIGQEA
jgi:hypothetical protein